MKYSDFRKDLKTTISLPPELNDPDDDLFTASTDDGHIFTMKKFKCQRHKPVPESIQVIIKQDYDQTLRPSIDLEPLIAELYTEGETYDFTVKTLPSSGKQYYEIEDNNGLYFRLFDTRHNLMLRQQVRCKVTRIKQVLVFLKLVESGGEANRRSGLTIADVISLPSVDRGVRLWFTRERIFEQPIFTTARRKEANGDFNWVFDFLTAIDRNMTAWLSQKGLGSDEILSERTYDILDRILFAVRDIALYLLEDSDYLRQSSQGERTVYQRRLNTLVQNAKHYLSAARKLREGTYEDFIRSILTRLNHSGYIYHPDKQFHIMMTIFRLKPSLVNSKMSELFTALQDWPIENWNTEPFRSAFVEMLEMYINERRHIIDDLAEIDDAETDRQSLLQVTRAIAIQLLLADKGDDLDLDRNRALLYRCLSHYGFATLNDNLISKAVKSLCGAGANPLEYKWPDTKQVTQLATNMGSERHPLNLANAPLLYYHGQYSLVQLAPGHISIISPADATGREPANVLPNGFLDGYSVLLPDEVKVPSQSKMKDLSTLRSMWNEIEQALLNEPVAPKAQRKQRLDAGDTEVAVVLDDYDEASDSIHCTVVDDYLEGEGWLEVSSIAPFKLHCDTRAFTTPEGEQQVLYADVKSIDNDGVAEFSMIKYYNDWVADSVRYGDTARCVITNVQPSHLLGVSIDGFTVRIPRRSDDIDEYRQGDHLIVRVESAKGNNIEASIERRADDTEMFHNSDTFTSIIDNLAIGTISKHSSTANDVQVAEETIDADTITELIQLIRRRAVLADDYVKAYNLLSVAQLLAKIIDDEELTEVCSTHLRLLELTDFFAKNSRTDSDAIAGINTEVIEHSPILDRLYRRLLIVDSLDTDANKDMLWHYSQEGRNDTERELARLVLSVNSLSALALDDKDAAEALKPFRRRIQELLNVHREAATAKYYGEENIFTEFKSSIVFPPVAQGYSKPDVDTQMRTQILPTICAFLNTKGGKLYIGVADWGEARGLKNDLEYFAKHLTQPKQDPRDRFKIEIDNYIKKYLGTYTASRCSIKWEDEDRRLVCIIEVEPSRDVVELEGTVWVKTESSKLRVTAPEELAKLRSARPTDYDNIMKTRGSEISHDEAAIITTPAVEPAEEPKGTADALLSVAPTSGAHTEPIATSQARDNDPQSDAAFPIGFIYFRSDGTYIYSENNLWLDAEDDTLLTLVLHEEDRTASLLLLYDNAEAVKVPLSDIMEKEQGKPHKRNVEHRLLFASPAQASDTLFTILENSKGMAYYRIDNVENIERGSMTSGGTKITDAGFEAIIYYDVLRPKQVKLFRKKPSRREIGQSLKIAPNGTKEQAIEELKEELSRAL